MVYACNHDYCFYVFYVIGIPECMDFSDTSRECRLLYQYIEEVFLFLNIHIYHWDNYFYWNTLFQKF